MYLKTDYSFSREFLDLESHFPDESDVEFDGFMPEVHDESELDENHVDDDDEEDVRSQVSSSPIPEEEFEFERGLQFGAVNGSESSDDEFDLHAPKVTDKENRH